MGRLIVFYDGWCPLCTGAARWLQRLDVFNRLELLSFRDPDVARARSVDLRRAENRLICRLAMPGHEGEYDGIDAVIQVVLRLPVFWPLLPLLWCARLLGFGQSLYDFMARRRRVIPAGNCGCEGCST